MTGNEHDKPQQAVRFSSENETKTIEAESSLEQIETLTSPPKRNERDDLTQEAQEELKNLSVTLQKSRLQTKRMENFAYDPVSLPASRVSHSCKTTKGIKILTTIFCIGPLEFKPNCSSIWCRLSSNVASRLYRPDTSTHPLRIRLKRAKIQC